MSCGVASHCPVQRCEGVSRKLCGQWALELQLVRDAFLRDGQGQYRHGMRWCCRLCSYWRGRMAGSRRQTSIISMKSEFPAPLHPATHVGFQGFYNLISQCCSLASLQALLRKVVGRGDLRLGMTWWAAAGTCLALAYCRLPVRRAAAPKPEASLLLLLHSPGVVVPEDVDVDGVSDEDAPELLRHGQGIMLPASWIVPDAPPPKDWANTPLYFMHSFKLSHFFRRHVFLTWWLSLPCLQ